MSFLRAHQQTKIWQFLTFKKYFTSTTCELFTAIREAVLVDSISASHRKATSEGTMVPKYPNWGCSPSKWLFMAYIWGWSQLLSSTWDDLPSTHSLSATSPALSSPKEAFGHKAVRCEFLAGTAKHDQRYDGNPLFVPRFFFDVLCYKVLYRLISRG